MSARSWVRSIITADATLLGLGVVAAGVLAGDVDTPRDRPFINIRWGVTTPGVGGVDRRSVVVWVHDKPGDYTRIDTILKRIKFLLAAQPTAGTADMGGGYAVGLQWLTDSDDLVDDGHGTITRTTTHLLVGSGL